ncbi:MAG: class I SAM-dependent methyltransferase, partial [Okeania sp. SIO2H7]|nr:class I SAM-dependent methyltransferase [Okeania sp. SIO2H7]
CEIGTYLGSTLIGALIDRPEVSVYAIDIFSKFDLEGENFNILSENLSKFGLSDRVTFYNQDMQEFFVKLRNNKKKRPKIGVYFYDGSHDYRSQLLALLYVKPFLAKQALIVVDDSNSPKVKEANWHFIATHPQSRMLFDFTTPKNGYHTFWNGIQVLSWDVTRKKNYSWPKLKEHLKK